MALSVFDDKAHKPSDDDLAESLGRSAQQWHSLKKQLQQDFGPLLEEWNFAGSQFGWSLRMKEKKRVLVYMTPQARFFLAGIVLGSKAVETVHESDIPTEVMAMIDAAKPYAEGRGIRIPVKTKADLQTVLTLLAAKTAR